jgi:hypothetical protein
LALLGERTIFLLVVALEHPDVEIGAGFRSEADKLQQAGDQRTADAGDDAGEDGLHQ